MRQHENIKTIYARAKGLALPQRVKDLLVGAEVVWFDRVPLSQDMSDELHFFFKSNASGVTNLLLKKHGIVDVEQYVNIKLKWRVTMEIHYALPNHPNKKGLTDYHEWIMSECIFPMSERFKSERDTFYILRNMEHLATPDDHKNKAIYATTKFTAVVVK